MKQIFSLLILASAFLVYSCATSKSPASFYSIFPTLTQSKHITRAEIGALVNNKQCILVTENRQYHAPLAGSVNGDMKKGAKGVDEFVQLDSANAYVIKNFSWINYDSWGSSQLYLEFDTYKCQ